MFLDPVRVAVKILDGVERDSQHRQKHQRVVGVRGDMDGVAGVLRQVGPVPGDGIKIRELGAHRLAAVEVELLDSSRSPPMFWLIPASGWLL